jgi:secreted trypsin-like serine protease
VIIEDLVLPVEVNEFPTVVCISKYIVGESLNRTVFCSGVMISMYHVLTAEECFYEITDNLNESIQITVSNGDLSQSTTY